MNSKHTPTEEGLIDLGTFTDQTKGTPQGDKEDSGGPFRMGLGGLSDD